MASAVLFERHPFERDDQRPMSFWYFGCIKLYNGFGDEGYVDRSALVILVDFIFVRANVMATRREVKRSDYGKPRRQRHLITICNYDREPVTKL